LGLALVQSLVEANGGRGQRGVSGGAGHDVHPTLAAEQATSGGGKGRWVMAKGIAYP
jgi:hypothetical protein